MHIALCTARIKLLASALKAQPKQQIVLLLLLLVSSTQGGHQAAKGHTSQSWWGYTTLGRRLRASSSTKLYVPAVSVSLGQLTGGKAAHSSGHQTAHSPSDRRLLGDSDVSASAQTTNSTPSNSSSSSNGTLSSASSSGGASTDGGAKLSLNPWYDQHLLSTTGGWGSGLLYGSINSSSKGSLDSLSSSNGAATDQGMPQAAQDPPPYEYPPVRRHPTVFFTAVLHNFGGTNGLRPEEQIAFSSAINAFLAPSANSVITNTTILTQALAPSGLWLPCATAFFTSDSAALQDYLAATLQNDPNLILPTATWGSARTANIKVAQPAAPASISYNWVVGDYSNCSVMCGGGTQQRQVACLDNYGNSTDPSMCTPPVPASSRSCQPQPCQASLPSSFSLMLGPWSACNATCSYGSRTRTATCVSKEGYIGSLSNCNITPEDWICDNTAGCGGGTASRNATCIMASSGQSVSGSMCDGSQLDNSTQLCALGPCILFYWRAKELADCLPEDASRPCGQYLQRRGFDCVNMTSGEVVTNNYCSGPKPVLGEVECSRPTDVDCSNAGIVTTPPLPVSSATQPEAPTLPTVQNVTGTDQSTSSSTIAAAGSTGGVTANSSGLDSQQLAAAAAVDAAYGPQQAGPDESPPASTPGSSGNAQPAAASGTVAPTGNTHSSSVYNRSAGSWPGPAGAAGGNGSASGSSTGSLTMDIGTNSSSTPASTSSAAAGSDNSATTDATSTSASFPASTGGSGSAGTTGGSSSSSSAGLDLGPGAALPAWLLNNPTPELKAALGCQAGDALSADGQCCSGALIDSKGSCCEADKVDACGNCNGTGKAIDSLGICCPGVLDAQGICCTGAVDECGVCNGTNACDLKAELVAAVSPAVLFLVPASNANRRMRAALQDDVAASINLATGRAFEKSRITVMLSAYSGVGSAAPKSRAAEIPSAGIITASEGWEEKPPGNTSMVRPPGSDGYSTFLGTPVAAVPLPGPDSSSGSRPVQMDATQQAPEQLDAPATHANLAAQRAPSTGAADPQKAGVVERAATTYPAALWVQRANDQGGSQLSSSHDGVASPSGVVRRLQHASHYASLAVHGGRTLQQQQPAPGSIDADLDSGNAIRVSIVLKPPGGGSGSGADTGSILQALNALVGKQLSISGIRSRLTYRDVVSVVRAGTCGDGICQVNERLSWNNPDSCQADCALPFLSCPPFDTSRPACNGLGVCYNSIGSCACTRGYAGADCSSCAAGFKLVNGFCVAGIALAPPRMCGSDVCSGNLTDGASLAVIPPARSMSSGQAAVIAAVLGSMVVVAGAAVLVYRARWQSLCKMHAEEVSRRARMAAD